MVVPIAGTIKQLSFPNPAHRTLEKQNLLKLPKVVFRNHNTAFEFKQKDFRNYQKFLECVQHKNLKVFIHAGYAAVDILPCKPAFPVFAASVLQLLLQPLILVGQFTCRNAWSKSQAGLQVVFSKDLSLHSVLWITIA